MGDNQNDVSQYDLLNARSIETYKPKKHSQSIKGNYRSPLTYNIADLSENDFSNSNLKCLDKI